MNVVKLAGGTMLSGARDGSDLRVHGGIVHAADRAAVAALLLHGHPNGFTWADVQALKDAHETLGNIGQERQAEAVGLVAVRVVRLLPPEAP